jgi:hypothetical protein
VATKAQDHRSHSIPEKALDEVFGSQDEISQQIAVANQDEISRQIAEVNAAVIARYPASMVEALAILQGRLPKVAKTKTAKINKADGSFSHQYKYADLPDITDAIMPVLSELGLSFTTKPGIANGVFGLTYELRHVSDEDGSDGGFYPLPATGTPQTIGSAITYARRYVLCAMTGLAADEDDDGAAAESVRGSMDRTGITEPLATYLFERVANAQVDELATLWAKLVEPSGAAQQRISPDSMSWFQLFGRRLAQIIDAVRAPEDWKGLKVHLSEIGAAALPWPHEGEGPPTRFARRGREIAALAKETREVLELAISSADSLEDLDRARTVLRAKAAELAIHQPDIENLENLADERRQVVQNVAEEMATTQLDEQVTTLDPAEGTEVPEEGPGAEAFTGPAEPPWEPSKESSQKFFQLRRLARDAVDENTGAMIANFDGAFERGQITGDEHAYLHGLMADRPSDRQTRSYLQWLAEYCVSLTECDEVTQRTNAVQAGETPMNTREHREVSASTAARRHALRQRTAMVGS